MVTVIFDWKRTLYDPETKQLIDGALDLLDFLKQQGVQVVLIGKGSDDMYGEVERLGITPYFDQIIFREASKDTSQFTPFIDKNRPEQTIVIGDRARGEIAIGNELGATTIWIRQGKFSSELPIGTVQQPVHTVSSLRDAYKILSTLVSV